MLWVVLSCCGSCLFCNVVAHLYFLGTKQEWNLPNITAVSDNAANEKKALKLLNWTRFGCYGHRLNLIVKHSLEVNEVSRLLG